MTRLQLAELTSGVGALVLGVGLGALFVRWVGPATECCRHHVVPGGTSPANIAGR